MTDKPILYTLEEAKMELKRNECASMGHSFTVYLDNLQDEPTRLQCNRCGKQWWIGGEGVKES